MIADDDGDVVVVMVNNDHKDGVTESHSDSWVMQLQQGKHSARKPPKLIIMICKTSSQALRCASRKVLKLRSSEAGKLTN